MDLCRQTAAYTSVCFCLHHPGNGGTATQVTYRHSCTKRLAAVQPVVSQSTRPSEEGKSAASFRPCSMKGIASGHPSSAKSTVHTSSLVSPPRFVLCRGNCVVSVHSSRLLFVSRATITCVSRFPVHLRRPRRRRSAAAARPRRLLVPVRCGPAVPGRGCSFRTCRRTRTALLAPS